MVWAVNVAVWVILPNCKSSNGKTLHFMIFSRRGMLFAAVLWWRAFRPPAVCQSDRRRTANGHVNAKAIVMSKLSKRSIDALRAIACEQSAHVLAVPPTYCGYVADGGSGTSHKPVFKGRAGYDCRPHGEPRTLVEMAKKGRYMSKPSGRYVPPNKNWIADPTLELTNRTISKRQAKLLSHQALRRQAGYDRADGIVKRYKPKCDNIIQLGATE